MVVDSTPAGAAFIACLDSLATSGSSNSSDSGAVPRDRTANIIALVCWPTWSRLKSTELLCPSSLRSRAGARAAGCSRPRG